MTLRHLHRAGWLLLTVLLTACGFATDPATRLAFDIEHTADSLAPADGARLTLEHRTPSRSGECAGPYTVQLDEVGAIIVWCRDDAGNTMSSHSTSSHRRFVVTPRTYVLDKTAGSTLVVQIERRGDRVVMTDVR